MASRVSSKKVSKVKMPMKGGPMSEKKEDAMDKKRGIKQTPAEERADKKAKRK